MEDKINRTNYIIYFIFLPVYKDKAKDFKHCVSR